MANLRTVKKQTINSRSWKAEQDPNQTKLDGQRNYKKYLKARRQTHEELHQMREVRQYPQRGQQEVQAAPEDGINKMAREVRKHDESSIWFNHAGASAGATF